MALTLVTLKTYLDEAEKARHSLAMGDKVTTISNIDGGSLTYNQASMRQLTTYISYLVLGRQNSRSGGHQAPYSHRVPILMSNKLSLVENAAKATMSLGETRAYHYGAATDVKEFDSWGTRVTHPDQELLYERDPLVSRSRDLERNSGIISGLYQTYEDNIPLIVPTGLCCSRSD